MPPVFGPWLPSKMGLWSQERGIGTAVWPSLKAWPETSRPVVHSSMTTRLAGPPEDAPRPHLGDPRQPPPPPPRTRRRPASPKPRSAISWSTVASASSLLLVTIDPLPAARPSALTTSRVPADLTYSRAASTSLKVRVRVWGMAWRAMNSLAQALLDSISAAALVGPKAGMPAACSRSMSPQASGSSGATTTRAAGGGGGGAPPGRRAPSRGAGPPPPAAADEQDVHVSAFS